MHEGDDDRETLCDECGKVIPVSEATESEDYGTLCDVCADNLSDEVSDGR